MSCPTSSSWRLHWRSFVCIGVRWLVVAYFVPCVCPKPCIDATTPTTDFNDALKRPTALTMSSRSEICAQTTCNSSSKCLQCVRMMECNLDPKQASPWSNNNFIHKRANIPRGPCEPNRKTTIAMTNWLQNLPVGFRWYLQTFAKLIREQTKLGPRP